MKKVSVFCAFALLMFTNCIEARVIYDSTNNYVIHDGILRGQKRAAVQRKTQNNQLQAAFAAQIDYDEDYATTTTDVIRKITKAQSAITSVNDR